MTFSATFHQVYDFLVVNHILSTRKYATYTL